MTRILHDACCRYLASPPLDGPSPFRDLLERLGITLPPSLRLTDMAQRGWLQPAIRVRLPEQFLLRWKRFPSIRWSDILEEDKAPAVLWGLCSHPLSTSAGDPRNLAGNWGQHKLDDAEHQLTQWVASNSLDPSGSPPLPIFHPGRGREIKPWIDFYRYWQAYELAELLGRLRYRRTLWVALDPKSQLETLCQEFNSWEEHAPEGIRKIQSRWSAKTEVFDLISKYRTITGIWSTTRGIHPGASWAEARDEAREMAINQGVAEEGFKEAIRDHLLVLWRDWACSTSVEGRGRLTNLQLLLQEDISKALALLSLVTGEPVDPHDPFWSQPPDRMPRDWAPLAEALPYEAFRAREEFSSYAMRYLDDYLRVAPKSRHITESELEAKVKIWWSRSTTFRRLAIAFDRLHRHGGSEINLDNLVGLREETPIEYLNLSALHAERLLASALGTNRPKGFHSQLGEAWKVIAKKHAVCDVASNQTLLGELIKEMALLHDLPNRRSNPFLEVESTNQDPRLMALGERERVFLANFTNFAIMRNYAAHHDCIDDELFGYGWAKAGAEALIFVTVGALVTFEC